MSPLSPEAVGVAAAIKMAGASRSFLYVAMNPDPAKRGGIPFLPSVKIGKRRLIRTEALRAWLAAQELRSA